MRLIDVDKLIEEIKQEIDMRYMYSPKGFINVINNQPTAFDVDKVVSELEDYKMWKELLIYDLDFRERQIIKKSIEIAKEGGV